MGCVRRSQQERSPEFHRQSCPPRGITAKNPRMADLGVGGLRGVQEVLGVLRCVGGTGGAWAPWGAWATQACGVHGVPWVHGMLGVRRVQGVLGGTGVHWVPGLAEGTCSSGGLWGPCDTWGARSFGVHGVFGELRLAPTLVLLLTCPKTRGAAARGHRLLLLLD